MKGVWSREETIVAFNVYLKIPFKASSKTNPTVVKYAEILGRSPSSLNMKIGNFGRLDPSLQSKGITGLAHGAKMEEVVWREFVDDPEKLAFESERLIAEFSGKNLEESSGIDTADLPKGEERVAVVKQRVNQALFRSTVMSSYNYTCCISGVAEPKLLEACHILGWAKSEQNRMNPQNGLCMNSLFHKAYDNYLLAVSPDLEVKISEALLYCAREEKFRSYLAALEGGKISTPDKFLPKREFLEEHYAEFLARN